MQDAHGATGARNHFSLPGSGRAEAVLGTQIVYKADASETAGGLTCIEVTVPPGVGVPPHRHQHEDETFYVLAGRVVFDGDGCGPEGTTLEPGGFFHGPRGHVHGFRCPGPETARVLIVVTPGSGMGAMFGELAALGAAAEPATVAAVCARHGVTFATT